MVALAEEDDESVLLEEDEDSAGLDTTVVALRLSSISETSMSLPPVACVRGIN
jgi:hypothetical protein